MSTTKKRGTAVSNKRKRDWETIDGTDEHAVAFGALLKQARRAARRDVEECAVHLGVAEQTIRNYETGRTSPSIDTLVKLAPLLRKHPAELLLLVPSRFYDLSWLTAPVEVV